MTRQDSPPPSPLTFDKLPSLPPLPNTQSQTEQELPRLSSPPPPPPSSSYLDSLPLLPSIPTHDNQPFSYRTPPLPSPHLSTDQNDQNDEEQEFSSSFQSSLDDSFSSASDPSAFDKNEDNEYDVNEQKMETEKDFPSFQSSPDEESFRSSSETPFNWPFQEIDDEIHTSLAALQVSQRFPSPPTPVPAIPNSPTLSSSPITPPAESPPTYEIPVHSASLASLTDKDFNKDLSMIPNMIPGTTNQFEIQQLPEAVTPVLSPEPALSRSMTTDQLEVHTLPEAVNPSHILPHDPAVSPPMRANYSTYQTVTPFHILSPDPESMTPNQLEVHEAVNPSHILSPDPAVSPPLKTNYPTYQTVTPSHILSPDPEFVAASPPMTTNDSQFQTLPEAVTSFHIISPYTAVPYSSSSISSDRDPQHILSADTAVPYSSSSIPSDDQDAMLQKPPIYFEENTERPPITNGALDNPQYVSEYPPTQHDDTSEISEQSEFDHASPRVPYESGRSSDLEHVGHWSGSFSDQSSDASSILLSNHLPTPKSNDSPSTSSSNSYRSLTPPQSSYLPSPGPSQRHTSQMVAGNRHSFDQQSPASSLSGSTPKTYSLYSNSSQSQSQTSLPAPLSQAHLKPGNNASLLSYKKTLEMYRMQAKKMSGDLEIQFEFATFLVGIGGKLGSAEEGRNGSEEEELVEEGCRILKRLSTQGHAAAQYYLASCYLNGFGSGKQDWAKAFPLLQKASKHNHSDAAYLVAKCYASGRGVKRDGSRALQYYKKSAAAAHPGAMYALGMAFLTGNLAFQDSSDSQNITPPPPLPIRAAPRDGVKWLKRACDSATPEFSDALFELAKLHELGIDNVVFVDLPYAVALYTRAAELGHVRSMYRLGECFEFGKLGCELDPRRSIGWYQAAAENGHPDSCFAMTAWYLSGHPGLIPQNGSEAFRWAFKAAELGHPKATYATAYFLETGMGVEKDLESAMKWYRMAADLGDARAVERLAGSPSSGGMVGERGDDRRRKRGDDCVVM